ncbi:potassium transporter TrkH [Pseudooceanicola nanhaiensis]|jgi:trk system potassium uptake protein TrkH|uniref:Potassium transporter TrkH n=2 Tax=Pseudooceanicola nanhaiensis TaxID=375761 RepID=A0A917WC95_9RHOB|nr:potassium transporter TrkG [Pseudooceanicola nanhaiensis]GGL89258.1 potassium transporter TrkH [Pseudooceanicola nanhaiensis]
MRQRLKDQPIFLLLSGVMALSMMLPAGHALAQNNHAVARPFFYTGLLALFLTVLVAVARGGNRKRRHHKEDLGALQALLAAFVLLPLALAIPFHEAIPETSFLDAYFEMVSSFTTTGATLYPTEQLSDTLHLWRAQVAWMGGLVIWIAAAAVLAPLSLGGFEVTSAVSERDARTRLDRFERAGVVRRAMAIAFRLTPIYVGLTGALWMFLLIGGDRPLTAFCHAMSTMSTSGISPVGGVQNAASGIGGEMVIFLFLFFALSRMTFATDTTVARQAIWRDPEFRMGLALVASVPVLMFVRHWVAAFEGDVTEGLRLALLALWGGFFTVLSFLTTTGFESAEWETARYWSGLGTPGLILLGLAMVGGGVATTAGGVKLLRVFALYLAGVRELERLVHPHSISGAGSINRRMRRHGAFQAWIFFMLFAMTLAAATALFALLGSSFENSMVMSISALTTTGPLVRIGAETPIDLASISAASKGVFCAVMVLGRLELVAIIALLNPDLWRD